MLNVTLQYKDAFAWLTQRESQYKTYPSENEWMKAKRNLSEAEFFFYDVTQFFFGTEYPSENVYFLKVCEMKLTSGEWYG